VRSLTTKYLSIQNPKNRETLGQIGRAVP